MKKSSLVFFGNERLCTGLGEIEPVAIKSLLAAGYQIDAVVAHHENARSRQARPLEIASVAQQHKIPVLKPQKPLEILEQLEDFKADVGVLVAYGQILPQSIIDLFPRGIINLHPSLLPKYRGPTPIEQAILDGATETGISLMQLTQTMDSGPIYVQEAIKTTGRETKAELAQLLLIKGTQILIGQLPGIITQSNKKVIQDERAASYTKLIKKSDGQIDWHKPAVQLEREVRAYLGWPGSRTTISDQDIIITAAHVIPSQSSHQPGTAYKTESGGLAVASTMDSLAIDKLKPAGKANMSGSAWLAGHQL